MKRLLLTCVCILLGSVHTANADITIGATRSTYSAQWDKVDFHVTSVPDGTLLQLLEGTWTAQGSSAKIYLDSDDANWLFETAPNSSMKPPPAAPLSYCNFAIVNEASTWSRSGSGNAYETFTGSWYTSTDAKKLRSVDVTPTDGIDQTLLATMYVAKGGGVGYSGVYGLSDDTTGDVSFSLAPVPEPSAILLSGIAGLALLAFRFWGRRRARAVA
jgi:hypothetical protein